MSCKEMQEEEREVLTSIYDGDENFKQIGDTTYQYKIGEDGNNKSFITEVAWPDNYPDDLPTVNLDLFYNKHIIQSVKDAVHLGLMEQAKDLLGMSMTFTLFEWVKDNADSLLENQPDTYTPVCKVESEVGSVSTNEEVKVVKERKDQLSKAQKRRVFDKFGAGGERGERPRGWDWVDIIKHLAQTGGKEISS